MCFHLMKAKTYDIDPMSTDDLDAEKLEERASELRKVSHIKFFLTHSHKFQSYAASFSNTWVLYIIGSWK